GDAAALGLLGLDQAPGERLQIARRIAQRRLGPALLGDVEARAQDLDRLAVRAAQHLAVAAQVAHLAVGPHDALLHREAGAVDERARHRGADALAILRVHALQIRLESGLEAL